MDLVFFNIFINHLDNKVDGLLVKFVDVTVLRAMANTLKDRKRLQSNQEKIEH